MRKLLLNILLWLGVSFNCYAANKPLIIAVDHFTPPFVMQSSDETWTGFDINLMLYLCKNLQRECQFKGIGFESLLSAINHQEADVAVSAITITPERSKILRFSLPYLPSQSRFLGPIALSKQPFNLTLLENKKIGVEEGTIFVEQLHSMNLKGVTVEQFREENELIDALSKKTVDLVLIDNADALYWQMHSSNTLSALGIAIPYGSGYAIVVNPAEPVLLNAINSALNVYLKSEQFKQDYQTYFGGF